MHVYSGGVYHERGSHQGRNSSSETHRKYNSIAVVRVRVTASLLTACRIPPMRGHIHEAAW